MSQDNNYYVKASGIVVKDGRPLVRDFTLVVSVDRKDGKMKVLDIREDDNG